MLDILSVIEKYGYSKQMLADKIGCSHQSIMQIVNSGSNPTYKKLQLIADAIGADIREFFPSTEDIKKSNEIRGSFNCPVCGKPLLVSIDRYTEEVKPGPKPSKESCCPHCKETILVSIVKNQTTTRCIRRQEVVRQRKLHNTNNQPQ